MLGVDSNGTTSFPACRRIHAAIDRLSSRRVQGLAFLAVLVLTFAWAFAVANLTLFAAPGSGPRNAIPFRTIWEYLSDTHAPIQVRVRNLGGNLVMLAPLGAALAWLTTWRLARVATALLAMAVAIEVWQLAVATGRSVDVDDVILNVTGGLAGWLAGLALLRVAETLAPGALVSGAPPTEGRPSEVHSAS